MQIKIYFYIQWPWDNNATGIVVEYQLIVAAIAPSYVSRSIKGDVHPGFFQFTTFSLKIGIIWLGILSMADNKKFHLWPLLVSAKYPLNWI